MSLNFFSDDEQENYQQQPESYQQQPESYQQQPFQE